MKDLDPYTLQVFRRWLRLRLYWFSLDDELMWPEISEIELVLSNRRARRARMRKCEDCRLECWCYCSGGDTDIAYQSVRGTGTECGPDGKLWEEKEENND